MGSIDIDVGGVGWGSDPLNDCHSHSPAFNPSRWIVSPLLPVGIARFPGRCPLLVPVWNHLPGIAGGTEPVRIECPPLSYENQHMGRDTYAHINPVRQSTPIPVVYLFS